MEPPCLQSKIYILIVGGSLYCNCKGGEIFPEGRREKKHYLGIELGSLLSFRV
jgi:hypothetical protein